MSPVVTAAIATASIPSPVRALRTLDCRGASDQAAAVLVIDENVAVRQSLESLIRSQGWQAGSCRSAGELLAEPRPFVPSCLILAFSSKQSDCLEVQKRLARERADSAIVVIADYEHIPTAVEAMKAGATDFLLKPFGDELVLAAIREGLAHSQAALRRATEMRGLRDRYASLTTREQQVMALVVCGLLNKQVGGELGISEITVKAHRGRLMQKMRAGSLPHLVNMASKLRLAKPFIGGPSLCASTDESSANPTPISGLQR